MNPILSLVERGGRIRSFHVPSVIAATLAPIITRHAHEDLRFMTDELRTYIQVGQTFAYRGSVNRSAKEYVHGEDYTNTVEELFSILKRGMYGVYQHVSEAHLHRYLSEFDFRYSNRIRLGIDDKARADLTLVGAHGQAVDLPNSLWTPGSGASLVGSDATAKGGDGRSLQIAGRGS